LVPVGEDQSAHLEIAREIVRRFNNFYGEVLVEPQIKLTPTPKVPGTDGRKMSKSYGNAINISDTPEVLWEKLRTMMTDPARERRTDPGNPEKCPVWDIHKVFNTDEDQKNELFEGCRTAGIGCVDCKKKLREHVEKAMIPIRERRAKYENNQALLETIIREGALKAQVMAGQTMEEVVNAIGFVSRER
nr:tryptophan--tRNA ligase [Synergistales bacterium]